MIIIIKDTSTQTAALVILLILSGVKITCLEIAEPIELKPDLTMLEDINMAAERFDVAAHRGVVPERYHYSHDRHFKRR